MPWPRRDKKDQPKLKPVKPKPYNRDKEGKGTCSHCGIKNGHRPDCWKGGT